MSEGTRNRYSVDKLEAVGKEKYLDQEETQKPTSTPDGGNQSKNQDLRSALTIRKQGGPSGKNIWLLKDYTWSSKNDYERRVNTGNAEGTDNYPDIQKIIIREYQPNVIVDIGKILDAAGGELLSLFYKPSSSTGTSTKSVLGAVTGGLGGALGAAAPRLLETYLMNKALNNPEALTSGISMIARNMFSGPTVGYYECPFFEETYNENSEHGSWTQLGAARLGGKLATAAKEGANIDFPSTPTWSLSDAKGFKFSFGFWLINSDQKTLEDNFKFLHSFLAGSFWLQLSLQQKSPNVYGIIVPGRFRKFFTSLDFKVTAHGKHRRCETSTIPAINNNLMPEVWKLTIDVEDLTPNTFNAYADFVNTDMSADDGLIEVGKPPGATIGGISTKYFNDIVSDKFLPGNKLVNKLKNKLSGESKDLK